MTRFIEKLQKQSEESIQYRLRHMVTTFYDAEQSDRITSALGNYQYLVAKTFYLNVETLIEDYPVCHNG